jgi:ribonuclease Z
MSYELAFLGTGTCNSTNRNPAALALSDGSDVVMIDFGGGAYHQLSRLGKNHFRHDNISLIMLTHFHVDHVSGIPDFFWGEMWDSSGAREKPITIAGPQGLSNFMEQRLLPFMGGYEVPFPINLVELSPGDTYGYTFFTAQMFSMSHSQGAGGYLFDLGGNSLAVTGDTGFCEGLVEMLSQADIAVMEWSNPGSSDSSAHISGDDISQLIKMNTLPGSVYFTHIYLSQGISFEEQVNRNRELLDSHSGKIHFPHDCEIIEIE